MVQSLIAFITQHKKFFIIGVGLLLALYINSDVLYMSQKPLKTHTTKPQTDPHKVNIIPIKESNIVKTHIREKLYYTQGLTFKDSNTLIESAGLYGESAIQYLDLKDFKVIKSQPMNPKYFGEGCEYVVNNDQREIYQLTWREGKVVVWNADDLSLKREIDFPQELREGWGIVKRIEKGEDGKDALHFYISNGSSFIYVVDAVTWKILRKISVQTVDGKSLKYLNELEFIHGKLWANMYYSNMAAVIDIQTGIVDTMVDFALLKSLASKKSKELGTKWQQDYVLNGIAYDEPTDKLVISGKYWPTIWEIEVKGVY